VCGATTLLTVNPDVLVALVLLEYALAVFAILSGRGLDLLTIFIFVLLLRPSPLATPALVVAGAVAYAASVVWRLMQTPTPLQRRARLWLFERGPLREFWTAPRSPVAIAGALGLTLAMPDAYTLGALLAYSVVTPSLAREWEVGPVGRRVVLETIAASAMVLVLAFLFTTAAGGLAWATAANAADVLPQLLTVQVALGFLPLSAATFAVPLVAGAAGAGAAGVLPWNRVGLAILLVLASIGYDLYLLGAGAQTGDLEWAEIIAVAVVVTSLAVAVGVAAYLQPARVAALLVQRLDRRWVVEVVRTAQDSTASWVGPEPFRDIERLLYIAATKESDIRLFNATLRRVLDRLPVLVRGPAGSVSHAERSLDQRFAQQLSALLEDAARQGKAWVLDTLIRFRAELTERTSAGPLDTDVAGAPPFLERTTFAEPPSGLALLTAIADAAIDLGLSDVGQFAVHQAATYVDEHLDALPDPTGVYDLDPTAAPGYQPNAPAQRAQNGMADAIDLLNRWARRAIERDELRIADAAAHGLSRLTTRALALASPHWTRWLAMHVASSAYFVASDAITARHLCYRVPQHWNPLVAGNASHAAGLDAMTMWTVRTLARCAPLASYGLVADAAMLALACVPAYPSSAAAIAAGIEFIGALQRTLPAPEQNAIVISEAEQRVLQLRASAGARAPAFDAVRTRVFTQLRAEFELPAADGEGASEVF
jgi:hypothetical protein